MAIVIVMIRVTIPDLEQVISLEKKYRFLSQLYRDPYDWNDEIYHNLKVYRQTEKTTMESKLL